MSIEISCLVPICLGFFIICFFSQECIGKEQIEVKPNMEKVSKYGKIEFQINLDTVYSNPFAPDEVDLSLDIKSPGGRIINVPAFCYQYYEQKNIDKSGRMADWLYPIGKPVWKARYAPDEVGRYVCSARLKDRHGLIQSDFVSFDCIASQSNGFVGISRMDPRFFEFSSGSMFFPIGQNLAFIGETQYVSVPKAEETFKKMSNNGANFARIWTCCEDWAMAIEARKSVWGKSWYWNPSIVQVPGRRGYFTDYKCIQIAGEEGTRVDVSPCHPIALRPDTKYIVSGSARIDTDADLNLEINNAKVKIMHDKNKEWTDFKYEFATSSDEWWLGNMRFILSKKGTAWIKDLSIKEESGEVELLWEADVNRPAMGYYNQLDCFMLDKVLESAEENGIYLQLCLLTRDLYMDLLKDDNSPEYQKAIDYAKKLLRYAVARWGYSTNVAIWEYFNEINPNLPTGKFYTELGDYLEQIDPYKHLRATSAWAPCEANWIHTELDTADFHWYLRPAWGEIWKDEVAGVIDRVKLLRKSATNKPALLSEFGLADDKWMLNPYMKQDKELVHFHNIMWASALSGLSGCAAFWWWEQLDMQDAYRHYKPLSAFIADIPFTTADLHEISASASQQHIRVIGLQGKDSAYVWLFNSQAKWWNTVVENIIPAMIANAKLQVKNLSSGTYQVQWWDTWAGKISKEEAIQTSNGSLELLIPVFTNDMACKITKK